MRERKIAAVVVEHDVDAVFACCGTVTVLDLGRHLATGTPQEIRADHRVVAAYLGTAGMNALRIEKLVAGYGASTVLHGVDLTVDEGDRWPWWAATARENPRCCSPCFARPTSSQARSGCKRAGSIALPGYMAAKLGISIAPQGARILPNLTVKENLLLSKATGRAGYWSLRAVYDLFPVLEERAEPAWHHAERRAAANAGDRARADGQPKS